MHVNLLVVVLCILHRLPSFAHSVDDSLFLKPIQPTQHLSLSYDGAVVHSTWIKDGLTCARDSDGTVSSTTLVPAPERRRGTALLMAEEILRHVEKRRRMIIWAF